jgi:perosamine synthetase
MKITRYTDLEKEYVLKSLEGECANHVVGKDGVSLEKAFAAKMGTKHAINFVNGTATLHSALEAAGVGIGDEVIAPPLTMSATSIAILQANAIPVFADIDEKTFLISPKSIEEKITERTKAIIIVSLYGLMPDMDAIMDIAKRHNLVVIEDDAQCFLGTYKGRKSGTIGHMSSFSFQATKHMTSGEGGMVTTDVDEYALNLRRFAGLGYGSISLEKARITKNDIQDPAYNRHVSLGWNYRMADVAAALAHAQLDRLDELVASRQVAGKILEQAMEGCDWLIPQYTPAECEHAYWAVAVRMVNPDITWYDFRNKFMELGGDGIYAAWKLTYLEEMFRNMNFGGREKLIRYFGDYSYGPGLCPVAETIQPQLLQFKTNYYDSAEAEAQAEILKKTIEYFGK